MFWRTDQVDLTEFNQKWRVGTSVGTHSANLHIYATNQSLSIDLWRRRRDSNPRDPSGPTPLAGERLRPLGHVSTDAYSQVNIGVTRQKPPVLKFSYLGKNTLKMALSGTEWHWVWETFGQFPLQGKRLELRQDNFAMAIAKREDQRSKSVSVNARSNRSPFCKEVWS